MFVSLLKFLCYVGYGVCGVMLIAYLIGYLKIKKQIRDSKDD